MIELNRPVDMILEDAIAAAEDLAAKAKRQCVVWRVSKGGEYRRTSSHNYWLRFDDPATVARLSLEGLDGLNMTAVYIANAEL